MPLSSISPIDEPLYKEMLNILIQHDQQHLLKGWNLWTTPQKTNFIEQIHALDFKRMYEERRQLHEPLAVSHDDLKVPLHVMKQDCQQEGCDPISQGKVALLIVAGGVGSRLGIDGIPKGCIPLEPFQGRTLFEIVAKKIVAMSEKVKRPLHVAIMTSSANDLQVRAYFQEHQNFGLSAEHLFFLMQQDYPYLSYEENLCLDAPGHVAMGPNGNGYAPLLLKKAEFYQQWKREGVEYLSWIAIDNPFADPFDTAFAAFHVTSGNDVSIKGVERVTLDEKMGLLVENQGKIQIIEYSEVDHAIRNQPFLGNTGMYFFSLSWIDCLEASHFPLHYQKKEVKYWDVFVESDELKQQSGKCYRWKFEHYIFDGFIVSNKTGILCVERTREFVPLKDKNSLHSIQSACDKA